MTADTRRALALKIREACGIVSGIVGDLEDTPEKELFDLSDVFLAQTMLLDVTAAETAFRLNDAEGAKAALGWMAEGESPEDIDGMAYLPASRIVCPCKACEAERLKRMA